VEAFHTTTPPAFLEKGGLGLGLTGSEKWNALKDFFIHNMNNEDKSVNKIDETFDFSRYISASMDQQIEDVIDFSEFTWLLVLLVFVIHATTFSLFEYGYMVNGVSWAEVQMVLFCTIAALIAYGAILKSRHNLAEVITKALAKDYSIEKSEFASNHSVETWVTRILQGIRQYTLL